MDNSFGSAPAPNEITKDERMLALFSHLSIFLGGIVLPIVFWATNKDKSKFVTFHALQAIWFHVVYIAIIVILVMFMLFAGFAVTAVLGSHPVVAIMFIAVYGFVFIIIMAAIIYAVYMGIKAYNGELKKYPIVGNMMYKKVYGDQK